MNTDVAQKGASTNNKHTPGPWINKPGFYGSGATAGKGLLPSPCKFHSVVYPTEWKENREYGNKENEP